MRTVLKKVLLSRHFAILFLIGITGVSLQFLFQDSSCIRVPVSFSSFSDKPLIHIQIENLSCPVLLDLGSSQEVYLRRKVLSRLKQKTGLEERRIMDIKGNIYSLQSYRLPFLKMGSLRIQNPVVLEESPHFITHGSNLWPLQDRKSQRIRKILKRRQGSVGRAVFQKYNCYFDFPHSVVFIIKDEKKFKEKRGWDDKNFVKIPFQIGEYGIVLSGETDMGTKRFLLDTGATVSLLKGNSLIRKRAREVESEKRIFTNRNLSFKDCNFGKLDFVVYPFPDQLSEIDGILGIEFFKNHEIYIDFQRKVAYLKKPKICG